MKYFYILIFQELDCISYAFCEEDKLTDILDDMLKDEDFTSIDISKYDINTITHGEVSCDDWGYQFTQREKPLERYTIIYDKEGIN